MSAAFRAWIEAQAPTRSSFLAADLDGDSRTDDVAWLELEGRPNLIVISLTGGQAYAFVTFPALEPGLQPPRLERGSLHISYLGVSGNFENADVRFEGGRLVLAGWQQGGRYSSTSADYVAGIVRSEDYETEPMGVNERAALRVGGPGAQTWMAWQKGRFEGERDARLEVRAREEKGRVWISLRAEDDRRVPPTGPGDLVQADHFELWFGPSVQLGVGVGASGLVTRWFLAPDDPTLPVVRQLSESAVEVELPSSVVPFIQGSSPFAAVYSDSDGDGQETLISTTSRRPGDGALGSLVFPAPGASLPAFSGIVQALPVQLGAPLRPIEARE